jgi:hypothetical protein
MEELRELEQRYSNQGLLVLGVSIDSGNRRSVVRFLNRHRVSWPQFHDGRGVSGDLAKAFGVRQVPLAVLLDREGEVASVFSGGAGLAEAVKEEMERETAQAPNLGAVRVP